MSEFKGAVLLIGVQDIYVQKSAFHVLKRHRNKSMGLQSEVVYMYLLHSFIPSSWLSKALYQKVRTLQLKNTSWGFHQQDQEKKKLA